MADSGVKFIRVNGRVVPIKGKDSKKNSSKDPYAGYTKKAKANQLKDDARMKQVHKVGLNDRNKKIATAFANASTIGAVGAAFFTKGKTRLGLVAAGVAGTVLGGKAAKKYDAMTSEAYAIRDRSRSRAGAMKAYAAKKNKTGV